MGLMLISILGQTLKLFPDGVMLLAFGLVVLIYFSWYSIRIKFVRLDNHTLYVFGWFKVIAIPLSEVAHAYYSGVGLVFVRLRTPSDFGSTIAFMPTFGASILSILGSPSIAEELRDLAKQASADSVLSPDVSGLPLRNPERLK
ncbi:MAG TPA: hypothetical protein VJS64_12295 [Pyrinomonadaceae bacterium]|nr:hypothetical protein [Pyrinomonadaceae bacterium]